MKDAKMWHTPKMSSPSRTLGPRVVFSPSAPFLGGCGGEQTRNRGFRERTRGAYREDQSESRPLPPPLLSRGRRRLSRSKHVRPGEVIRA